jgi:hypothetical protein
MRKAALLVFIFFIFSPETPPQYKYVSALTCTAEEYNANLLEISSLPSYLIFLRLPSHFSNLL